MLLAGALLGGGVRRAVVSAAGWKIELRGAEIFAVEAEDHYLRLHTSRGSDLILMRLSDAVAELEAKGLKRTAPGGWRGNVVIGLCATEAEGSSR